MAMRAQIGSAEARGIDVARPQDGIGRSVGLLWLVGPSWYLLCEAISAWAFPGYRYATFYISDLGVPTFGEFQGRMLHSSLSAVMNAGFLGEGLLFLLGLILIAPRRRRGARAVLFVLFGIAHAVGIAFVGLVPGSPENAALGLILIHVIGAVGAIGGGNLAAILSGPVLGSSRATRLLGPILGTIGLGSAVLLSTHVLFPDGVWERGAVYTFLLWQLIMGVTLLRGGGGSGVPAAPSAAETGSEGDRAGGASDAPSSVARDRAVS